MGKAQLPTSDSNFRVKSFLESIEATRILREVTSTALNRLYLHLMALELVSWDAVCQTIA